MGNEDDSVIIVKRKRNIKEWKDNKAKRLKALGLEYTSKKGKNLPARSTGTTCR